jgi:hypothetical protein
MAHAKVPVRASMSKFPGCAVGGVEGKARNAGNGNFISRFFPTPFSQACYALNTQTRAFSGTTPSSSFLSFQVRLAPGLRGAKTRARRVLLSGNLTHVI